MQKSIFMLFLLGTSCILKAQSPEDSLTWAAINGVINTIQFDQTKLIYKKDGVLIIDSTLFRKATYTPDNRNVKITLKAYTSLKINTDDFWGLVTDFGQCQRYFNGKNYIVWHTKAPYIYRDYAASDRKIKYFYSKTLTSEVVPLTKENIHEIVDAKTIEQLQSYLKTHDLEKAKDGGASLPSKSLFLKDAEGFAPTDFFMFHIQIAWAILEVLMRTAK